ncbi:hypothetical protein JW911_00900 [Candidatus Peregrinibacteria bacterium]|nr:hypothetical protein [Candidatus Peregrinibacteria bacterium]
MRLKSEPITFCNQSAEKEDHSTRHPLVKPTKLTPQKMHQLKLNANAEKYGDLIYDQLEKGNLTSQEVYNLFNARNYACLDFDDEAEDEHQNIALNVEEAIRTKAIHYLRFAHLYDCCSVVKRIQDDIEGGRVTLKHVLRLIRIDIGIKTNTSINEAMTILKRTLIEDKILHVGKIIDFVQYKPVKVNIQGREGEKFVEGMGNYGQVMEIMQDVKLDFKKLRLPLLCVDDIVTLEDGTECVLSAINERAKRCLLVKKKDGGILRVSPKNIVSRKFQEW